MVCRAMDPTHNTGMKTSNPVGGLRLWWTMARVRDIVGTRHAYSIHYIFFDFDNQHKGDKFLEGNCVSQPVFD